MPWEAPPLGLAYTLLGVPAAICCLLSAVECLFARYERRWGHSRGTGPSGMHANGDLDSGSGALGDDWWADAWWMRTPSGGPWPCLACWLWPATAGRLERRSSSKAADANPVDPNPGDRPHSRDAERGIKHFDHRAELPAVSVADGSLVAPPSSGSSSSSASGVGAEGSTGGKSDLGADGGWREPSQDLSWRGPVAGDIIAPAGYHYYYRPERPQQRLALL